MLKSCETSAKERQRARTIGRNGCSLTSMNCLKSSFSFALVVVSGFIMRSPIIHAWNSSLLV